MKRADDRSWCYALDNPRRLQSRTIAARLQLGRWVNGYKYILSAGSSWLSRLGETRLFARCHIHLRLGKAVDCLPRWWIACGIPGLTSNCRRVRGVRVRREKGECARQPRRLPRQRVEGKNGKGERKGVGGKKKKL